MEDQATGLSLDDLAQVVCEGNVDGELQERVAEVRREYWRKAQDD